MLGNMNRFCRECRAAFEVSQQDLNFYGKISPSFGGAVQSVPAPTLCPRCRLRRRLCFRNHIFVYLRPSSTTGKQIFSMFTEDVPFPVVSKEEWWGDGWDPTSFGREFDFTKSFFEQFEPLRNAVPHFPLSVVNMENSEYCNNAGDIKNCYLVFNTNNSQDSMYCESIWNSKNCLECTHTPFSELCYDTSECSRCYNVQSSLSCEDCRDSCFLLNCRSCANCFGCVNLRRAEFCILNQRYSREEYERFLGSIDLASFSARSEMDLKMRQFFVQHPRPHAQTRMVENVTGNFVSESRNTFDSFLVRGADNVRFGLNLNYDVKDCYDFTLFGQRSELLYECAICGINAYNMRFCFDCWGGVSDLDYCWMCVSSQNCFGCVGLKKKQYCILNKQYSQEEYQRLTGEIVKHMRTTGEWGEFFPSTLSPIPYNQSYAQRFYPLSEGQARAAGHRWDVKEAISRAGGIPASQLPDGLPSADTPITVFSAKSGRPFKITAEEIRQYRRFNVPLPRVTYDERMQQRAAEIGGLELFERACAKSGGKILTTYAPDSPWIVWDKAVYDQEFSG